MAIEEKELFNQAFELHKQGKLDEAEVAYQKVLEINPAHPIFEKIKKHFNLPSLDEALCELFKGKLTTDEANHSGEGIFFTSKMMDNFLISSSGKIFTSSKFDDDTIFDMNAHIRVNTCVCTV